MDEEEQDVYVAQLHEVFESCDREGKGFLNRKELIDLCKKLQLDDQVPHLLRQLLGSEDSDGEVTFDDFKEGFVAVLSQAIDALSSSDDEDVTSDNTEPPKLVVNEKRYGRRSRPDISASEDLYSADEESLVESRPVSQISDTHVSPSPEARQSPVMGLPERGERNKSRRRISSRKSSLRNSIRRHNSKIFKSREDSEVMPDEVEVLEASGQLSYSPRPVSQENGVESPSEEEQLRAIWNEVNVGATGHLDLHELSVVCDHIGMDAMNDQELSLLFEELDEDGDGKVSFDEFLHGLFAAKDSQDVVDGEDWIESVHSEPYQSTPYAHPASSRLKAPQSGASHDDTLFLTRTGTTSSFDLVTILDPEHTGFAKVEDIRELWEAQGLDDAIPLLEHIEIDADNKASLHQLTNLLESLIYEQSDGLSQAVVSIYKHEMQYIRSRNVESLAHEFLIAMASSSLRTQEIDGKEAAHTFEAESEGLVYDKQRTRFTSKYLTEYAARSQVDTVTSERDALRDHASKLSEEKEMLIQESEDTSRQIERLHEGKLKDQESKFLDKYQTFQQSMDEEREKDLLNASQQRSHLEDTLQSTKSEEYRLRIKLSEAEEEILRLEKSLADTQEKLSDSENTRERLEKELESMADLSSRLAEVEKQQLLKQQQNRNATKSVREQEKINRELRDENDELRLQNEALAAQVNSSVKRRSSHRKRQPGDKGVSRHGSVVSDYIKPTVIRRNKEGLTSSDESDHDAHGTVPSIRISGDGGSNEDADDDLEKEEQRKTIEKLQADLLDKEEQIKTHMMKMVEQESSISELLESAKIQENLMGVEVSKLTTQFTGEMEGLQAKFNAEREQQEKEYQAKMRDLQKSFESENESLKDELENGFRQEREYLIFEYEKERSDADDEHLKEKQTLEQMHNGQLVKEKEKSEEDNLRLRDKLQTLEDEKSESELKLINEKAELFQQFRIEKMEWELQNSSKTAELHKNERQWSVLKSELENGHHEHMTELVGKLKKERGALEEGFSNEIWELKQEHSKEIASLKQTFDMQKAETERTFAMEKSEIKESFTRDKHEAEQRFNREKAELKEILDRENGQSLAVQEAELKRAFLQEKLTFEKKYDEEKVRIEEEFQESAAINEINFQKWKAELEEHFTEEKAKILQNAAREKADVEQKYKVEINELRQAFTEGEAGLKGQLKDDFFCLLTKHKVELEESYNKEKHQLEESYSREKADLLLSGRVGIKEIEESYNRENGELEDRYKGKIKQLQENFARERLELEQEHKEEKLRLRSNLEIEFTSKHRSEMDVLQQTVKQLQDEINFMKEQKKELETKIQTLELRSLTRSDKDVVELKVARETVLELEEKVDVLNKQKVMILENSVQQINEQKIKLDELQKEKATMENEALDRERELMEAERVNGLDNETLRQEIRMRVSEKEELEMKLKEQGFLNMKLAKKTTTTIGGEVNELKQKMEEYEALLQLRDKEKQELVQKQEERDRQFNGLAATEFELKQVAQKNQEIETMLHNRAIENEELRARLKEHNAELENELAEIESEYKKVMIKSQELETVLNVRESEAQDLQKRLKERNQRAVQLEHQMSQLNRQLEDSESTKLDEMKAKLKERETKYCDIERQLVQRERHSGDLQRDVFELKKKLADVQTVQLNERETENQLLEERFNKKIDQNLLLERQLTLLTKRLADTDELRRREHENKQAKSELLSMETKLEETTNRKTVLEKLLQEKNWKTNQLQEEVYTLKEKLSNKEGEHRRDLEALRQKTMLSTAELSNVKSRHQRDVNEMKEQLHRANMASERDQALREKVFNEAKAEVLALNKKDSDGAVSLSLSLGSSVATSSELDEKSRRLRELESASQLWESRIRELERQKQELIIKVTQTRGALDEHVARLTQQVKQTEVRAIRSDTLVQELYIENSKLTKSLQQTEAKEKRADKTNRQLQEQKRALQRVISKLCGANAIA